MNKPQNKVSLRGCDFQSGIPSSEAPEDQAGKLAVTLESSKRDLKLFLLTEESAHPQWLAAIEAFTSLKS